MNSGRDKLVLEDTVVVCLVILVHQLLLIVVVSAVVVPAPKALVLLLVPVLAAALIRVEVARNLDDLGDLLIKRMTKIHRKGQEGLPIATEQKTTIFTGTVVQKTSRA